MTDDGGGENCSVVIAGEKVPRVRSRNMRCECALHPALRGIALRRGYINDGRSASAVHQQCIRQRCPDNVSLLSPRVAIISPTLVLFIREELSRIPE